MFLFFLFFWSRSTNFGSSNIIWVTLAYAGPINYDSNHSLGVAMTVFIFFLLWSRSFYDNTHDGCYVVGDGTSAGKYGGWVSYSYGVAMHVHFWSRSAELVSSGVAWYLPMSYLFGQTTAHCYSTTLGVAYIDILWSRGVVLSPSHYLFPILRDGSTSAMNANYSYLSHGVAECKLATPYQSLLFVYMKVPSGCVLRGSIVVIQIGLLDHF